MGNHTAVRARGRGKGSQEKATAPSAAKPSGVPARTPPGLGAASVEYRFGAQAAIQGRFGRALSDREVAALVGAQPGDRVIAELEDGALSLSLSHEGRRGGLDYRAKRLVLRDGHGGLIMHNEYFYVEPNGSGVGTRIFATQAHAAYALGIRQIETVAARGPTLNGYYTWPRVGYNADIPPALARRLPEGLAGATTVQDLMRTPQGRVWWKVNGIGMPMTFDPTPGSASMRMLDTYMQERGLA